MTTHVNGTDANGESSGISPKSASPSPPSVYLSFLAPLTHPTVTLWTSHDSPWAHRAAITLKCLNLPYEEVLIDFTKPRPAEYLEINPRGLVPSLKISNGILNDEVITESAIVATFLADNFPDSNFYPKSHESPTSALTRARMTFFVDTWFTKVNTMLYPILRADGEEKERLGKEVVAAVEKEIEPLLEGAGPFFGGSEVMTLAEVGIEWFPFPVPRPVPTVSGVCLRLIMGVLHRL